MCLPGAKRGQPGTQTTRAICVRLLEKSLDLLAISGCSMVGRNHEKSVDIAVSEMWYTPNGYFNITV